MTATIDRSAEPTAEEPVPSRARPVVSFVAALGSVIVVLAIVIWSGLAAPNVRARVESHLPAPLGRRGVVVVVGNLGQRPAEVLGLTGADGLEARLADPGTDLLSAAGGLTDPADLPPFAPFTLPGGANRSIVLTVADGPDCTRTVTVVVRSADVGITRRLEVAIC